MIRSCASLPFSKPGMIFIASSMIFTRVNVCILKLQWRTVHLKKHSAEKAYVGKFYENIPNFDTKGFKCDFIVMF